MDNNKDFPVPGWELVLSYVPWLNPHKGGHAVITRSHGQSAEPLCGVRQSQDSSRAFPPSGLGFLILFLALKRSQPWRLQIKSTAWFKDVTSFLEAPVASFVEWGS